MQALEDTQDVDMDTGRNHEQERCHAPNVFGTVDMEKVSR